MQKVNISILPKREQKVKVCNVWLIIFLCLNLQGVVMAQTANPQQYKYIFTVAKDGSGDYKYIQDAIEAMRG